MKKRFVLLTAGALLILGIFAITVQAMPVDDTPTITCAEQRDEHTEIIPFCEISPERKKVK
ncbi:MAG: hypothetical protein FWB88_05780 [Defluviitaleaceae bacterium]|nr:hypothetical protein [Defluviitaleaceae bacterium]MCL2239889.1 hypothetical protein [Defluviitaleaceae bacterium]